MNTTVIGPNCIEVMSGKRKILFSYNTPVAALEGGQFYKTNKFWSTTTSKHINKWLAGWKAIEIDQKKIDKFAK